MGKGNKTKETKNTGASRQTGMSQKSTQNKKSTSPSVIITLCISAAILISVIVWAALTKQANSLENLVAMEIGDTKVSGLEFQYNYFSQINSFYNNYYDYLSLFGVDFEQPLSSQSYSDDMTWADFFKNQTLESLKESILLYREAMANGYTLSNEDVTAINDEIDTFIAQLNALGYSTDGYIASVYGKGMTMAKYKDFVKKSTIIANYYLDLIDSYQFTKEDYQEYYQENKQSMDTADFRSYGFLYEEPTETEDEADIEDETETEEDENTVKAATKEEATASAEEFYASISDEASFEDYLYQNVLTETEKDTLSEGFTLSEDASYSSVSDVVAEWLFDESRREGDIAVIDDETNSRVYVLYFISCGLDEYNTINMRHILVTPEVVEDIYEEDGTTVDEEATEAANEAAISEAKTKAEDILNEWSAGAATEESFGELAIEYSEDGYASSGGLYESIPKDYFTIDEVNDWIYEASRKSGDTVIIESSYGFHIVYFIGYGEPAWELETNEILVENAYIAYIENLKETTVIEINEEVLAKIS